jgi:hypothetical protein
LGQYRSFASLIAERKDAELSETAKAMGEAARRLASARAAFPPLDAAKAKDQQTRLAKECVAPVLITNSIGMKLTFIPPGDFLIGELVEERQGRPKRVRPTMMLHSGSSASNGEPACHPYPGPTGPPTIRQAGGSCYMGRPVSPLILMLVGDFGSS